MAIRILTKNSIENTNIDGARANNFNASRRSGIVQGVLNEGRFFASSSNIIALETCELRIFGHRVVIDEVWTKTFNNIPSSDERHSLVAQIIVDDNADVTFSLNTQLSSTSLVQNNLDKTGVGKYEIEIGKFTLNTSGEIEDVVRTVDVITGGESTEWETAFKFKNQAIYAVNDTPSGYENIYQWKYDLSNIVSAPEKLKIFESKQKRIRIAAVQSFQDYNRAVYWFGDLNSNTYGQMALLILPILLYTDSSMEIAPLGIDSELISSDKIVLRCSYLEGKCYLYLITKDNNPPVIRECSLEIIPDLT